jgi:predicted Zn-dependent protease
MTKLAWLILATILATGCSRHHGVDTGNLASRFKTAEPTLKAEAAAAIKAIKAGNFPEALTELQKLAKRAKLDTEQQQAVKDVIAQIQKQMQDAANQAAENAKKAVPPKK